MPPLTEEDLTQVKDLINTSITGVVGNLKKGWTLDLQKSSKELGESLGKVLDDKLSKLEAAGGGEGGGEGGGSGKSKGAEKDRALETLRRQQDETNKRLEEMTRTATAERAKNRGNTLKGAIREVLEGSGITGARFTGAYAALMMTERVRYAADDSDDIVFVDETGEVDYRTGLSAWVKGDEAAIYLPPKGAQGAGTRPRTGQPQVKGGPVTPDEKKSRMDAALAGWAENR